MMLENGDFAVELIPLCKHLYGALPGNAEGYDIVWSLLKDKAVY